MAAKQQEAAPAPSPAQLAQLLKRFPLAQKIAGSSQVSCPKCNHLQWWPTGKQYTYCNKCKQLLRAADGV